MSDDRPVAPVPTPEQAEAVAEFARSATRTCGVVAVIIAIVGGGLVALLVAVIVKLLR